MAPWLVQLDPEASFTRWLFSDDPEQDSPLFFWALEPGPYFQTTASLDAVWKHFRKFTRVREESGNWFFHRFWEPRRLHTLLRDMPPADRLAFSARLANSSLCAPGPQPKCSRWRPHPQDKARERIDDQGLGTAETGIGRCATARVLNRPHLPFFAPKNLRRVHEFHRDHPAPEGIAFPADVPLDEYLTRLTGVMHPQLMAYHGSDLMREHVLNPRDGTA